jgi:hypothetical protein
MRHYINILFIVAGGILYNSPVKAQNIITCDMKKNAWKNEVIELKDNNQNLLAKIYRKNRTDVIESEKHRYVIKRLIGKSLVFYSEVNEDTIAVLTRNGILLKNEANYSIRTGRSGLKIEEDKEIILRGSYNPDLRYYHIEIRTPIYAENLINLLAGYYAARKCKELSRSTNNHVYLFVN